MLAGNVHQPRHAQLLRGLNNVESRHHVVAKDNVWWVVARVRDCGNVYDGIGLKARNERKYRARVLQVGLHVCGREVRFAGDGRVVDAPQKINANDVVASGGEVRRGGRAHLALAAREKHLHRGLGCTRYSRTSPST